MFHIIELESEKPIIDENGNVRTFDTFQNARQTASELNCTTGKLYQPRIIVNDTWKKREYERFNSYEYKTPFWIDMFFHQHKVKDEQTGREKLEWFNTNWPIDNEALNIEQRNVKLNVQKIVHEHFLHISKTDMLKIAYTISPEKGMLDVQTQKNVARYIANDLGMDETLATYIDAIHKAKYKKTELYFAKGKDIVEIYKSLHNTGVASCMTKPDDYYDSFCHPMLVYSEGDISLAYIKDENDKIVARALVWEDKKIYSRMYGDYMKLREALELLGYNSNDNFHGAKLKLIKDAEKKDRVVMPYLDGCQSFSIVNDSYIMIDDNGHYYATEQNGFSKDGKVYGICENCSDEITDEDNVIEVYNSRRRHDTWCRCCADDHAMICSSTNDYIHQDYVRYVDGEYYAEWVVEDECNYCDYAEEYTFSNVTSVIINENGDTENWNVDIIDEHSFVCRVNGERYSNKLKIEDFWNDEPRASFNIPDDMPIDENVNVIYHSSDVNQLNLGLTF
jgi:hypothetical protein